jgi:hypothetical protein
VLQQFVCAWHGSLRTPAGRYPHARVLRPWCESSSCLCCFRYYCLTFKTVCESGRALLAIPGREDSRR